MGDSIGDPLIEIDDKEEVEDPFLAFVDYARAVISPEQDEIEEEEVRKKNPSETTAEASGPGWGWIASRVLKTCTAYSSGVTAAILLSDLSQVPPTLSYFNFVPFLIMGRWKASILMKCCCFRWLGMA